MAVFFFIGSLERFDRVTVCVWLLVEDLDFFFSFEECWGLLFFVVAICSTALDPPKRL